MNHGRLTTLLIVALALNACGGSQTTPRDEPRATPAPRNTPGPVDSMTALEQMEIAFDGDHSQAEIQTALDQSLAQFGLEPNEDNYSRAGSVLVALSNNAMDEGCAACTEMAILDYMIRSYDPAMGGEWQEYAALASSFLWAEETSQ